MPMPAAYKAARPGLRARRNAAAAGPISRAVLRMAPIVSAARATDRASADHIGQPDKTEGVPWAAASSELIELSSKGR